MEEKRTGEKPHCTFILLAGGSGRRMGTEKPKQFLEIAGKPVICHVLAAVEQSAVIEDCIVVVAQKDREYLEKQILSGERFTKVKAVATGGRERFESVWKGLQAWRERAPKNDEQQIILIHDGARPFLTEEILEECLQGAVRYGACVAAVPSKDTIAIADEEGYEQQIPNRRYVWNVQTPQAFRADIIWQAFEKLGKELEREEDWTKFSWITDDASVAAHYQGAKIKLVQGDYRNSKVTTPEDLAVMEAWLREG